MISKLKGLLGSKYQTQQKIKELILFGQRKQILLQTHVIIFLEKKHHLK